MGLQELLKCSNISTLRGEVPLVSITTVSSREFNQDTSGVKKAALKGPVFITDRGLFAHVLLSYEEYQRLTGYSQTLADLLAMPNSGDVEFESERLNERLYRPIDLS